MEILAYRFASNESDVYFKKMASLTVLDALYLGDGNLLYKVKLSGDVIYKDGVIFASQAKVISNFDATSILSEFSRKQALINIHRIKKFEKDCDYKLLVDFLNSGNEEIRSLANNVASISKYLAEWESYDSEYYAALSAEAATKKEAWESANHSSSSSDKPWNMAMEEANIMLTDMVTEKFKEVENGI